MYSIDFNDRFKTLCEQHMFYLYEWATFGVVHAAIMKRDNWEAFWDDFSILIFKENYMQNIDRKPLYFKCPMFIVEYYNGIKITIQ